MRKRCRPGNARQPSDSANDWRKRPATRTVPAAWGLQLPDKWHESDPTQPLVLVLHGFNSSPQRFAPLAQALQEQGFVCGTYSYPDDQPILESAAMLSRDLTEIAVASA